MKHKIVIATNTQSFEFEGEIVEFEPEHIILKAKHGDIFIERKYLVFIQSINEEVLAVEDIEPAPLPVIARVNKTDQAAKFIKQRLKSDPLEQRLMDKLVPPSQFPDYYDADDELEQIVNGAEEDDIEVMRNTTMAVHGPNHPLVKAGNLQQAIKASMSDNNFSMGGDVKYNSPLQSVIGMSNATKKTRVS
jgi:hypothetical protein